MLEAESALAGRKQESRKMPYAVITFDKPNSLELRNRGSFTFGIKTSGC